jgi:hypothetical protein
MFIAMSLDCHGIVIPQHKTIERLQD